MSLSFSLTQNEMHKIFSLWEFSEKKKKNCFYEWGTMNYYTLLNMYSVLVITAVHRLTDSKIKIYKFVLRLLDIYQQFTL